MKLRNVITNEICDAEAREDGIYIKANWSDEEKWFCYDLETLARGWDYYVEPQEPLIKDEKIRKAVRAWAGSFNDVDEIKASSDFKEFWIDGYLIEFERSFDEIDSEQSYRRTNIAELCGEIDCEPVKEMEGWRTNERSKEAVR